MTTYESIVLADLPTLYWRLDETSGTTAADASGNGHHGTYDGSYGLGRAGAIRSDDGTSVGFAITSSSNSHVSVASPEAVTTDVTLECWAYMLTSSRKGCLMKNGTFQGNGTTTGNGYGVGVGDTTWEDSGNNLILLYEQRRWINTGVKYRTGSGYLGWNHVVVVFDSSGFPHCWLNGALVAEPAFNDQYSVAGSFYAGGYNVGSDRAFQGEMDEVALYGHQLTQAQIEEHYEAGMAHWSVHMAGHVDL